MTEYRAVLLDIEGTVTPISFVHDTLFPYARSHLKSFLVKSFDLPEVHADLSTLSEEQATDAEEFRQPAIPRDGGKTETIAATVTYVNHLIDLDRKSPGLKSLQGKIWKAGYDDGSLKSPVYADVVNFFESWHKAGISINIFSSGSVLAQRLLFANTDAGDLTPYINHYFDTNVGKKVEAQSYQRIAAELILPAPEIVFISDVVAELDAARMANLQPLLCIRPGNPKQSGA
ncbi:MAG TPA: acireductone synthase, partial [Pyrinomonadaceae bacterium]|nr:acireductone synthase [Pyrinomonadaceae bacterium]